MALSTIVKSAKHANSVERRRKKAAEAAKPPEAYLALMHTGEKARVMKAYRKSTKRQMDQVGDKWADFCDFTKQQDPRSFLKSAKFPHLKSFLKWYLDTHKRRRAKTSVYLLMRHWRIYYRDTIDEEVNVLEHTTKVTAFIDGDLTAEYNLSTEPTRMKPVLHVDDLLVLLNYHWLWCTAHYAVERERIQFALAMLMLAFTTARPSSLLETLGKPGSLKYQNVKLYLLPDPEDASRHTILMRLELPAMKNSDTKGPAFALYQRDDNLALCPIVHILALAFADDAFESPWINKPEDLDDIKCTDGRPIPLSFKRDLADTPILRLSRHTSEGYVTSPDRPYDDTSLRRHLHRLGQFSGFEDALTPYAFRRGLGTELDKNASAAVRRHAMGHANDSIYSKYYTPQLVDADTQALFLHTPSRDALRTQMGKMSFTRDPNAFQAVRERLAKTDIFCGEHGEELQRLQGVVSDLEWQMKQQTQNHRDTELSIDQIDTAKASLAQAITKAKAAHRSFKRNREYSAEAEAWAEHFRSLGTRKIDHQKQGVPSQEEKNEPPMLPFPERQRLAANMCRNEDPDSTSPSDLQRRRRDTLLDLVRLCKRSQGIPPREAEQLRLLMGTKISLEQTASIADNVVLSREKLQCPWCFNNPNLDLASRTKTWCKTSILSRHINEYHLSMFRNKDSYRCPMSDCQELIRSEAGVNVKDRMKNHMFMAHGLKVGGSKFF